MKRKPSSKTSSARKPKRILLVDPPSLGAALGRLEPGKKLTDEEIAAEERSRKLVGL